MRYRRWNTAAPDWEGRSALEREGLHPLAAAVLSARGVPPREARAFLAPDGEPLHDPMSMRDMGRAAARVRLALNRGETAAVYGDYDVDGITATCLLTHFLTGLGMRVIPYIPDRLEEGYGLNREAVSALRERGVTLIVTVDCGITAVEEVAWASSLGVDVVVTDHHECKSGLPAAAAVVDPHRPDCPYPFKGLAGVGVALKLAMALAGPSRTRQVLEEYADLAAIGTVADVMPMTGENRTIVRRGLNALAAPGRLGLAMLIREAGLEERPLNSTSIGYALAPRINAAGRMGRAGLAVELLLTGDPDRAAELAQELCRLNRERQAVELEIFEQCARLLERGPQQGAIVLAGRNWHQGVVGIVASRLAEQYGCPAFMICLSGGIGKGSCRSWGGVNLFALLERCQDLLEGFGGHELAAGFTVREENIPALARRLREGAALQIQAGVSEPELGVDVQLDDPALLDLEGVGQLERLEPYGTGNPRPVLSLTGAQVVSQTAVGGGRHLRLKLAKRGVVLDAILFSAADLLPELGPRVDAAFYPQINDFRGLRTVQLQIVDLRRAPSRAQLERNIYERYRLGEALSPAEARMLLPSRDEFAALWRYLKQQTALRPVLEDTAERFVRGAARASGRQEMGPRTMVCLDVLCERGLISLHFRTGLIRLSINHVEGKVDLEASHILRRLRTMTEE